MLRLMNASQHSDDRSPSVPSGPIVLNRPDTSADGSQGRFECFASMMLINPTVRQSR